MFNEAHVSLAGFVASQPRYAKVGKNKTPKLTLRVSWTNRRRDSATGEWVDGNTSYVNVICWRQLAENGSICLRQGDPVVVKGRLDVRTFTGRDDQRKTAVDVEAYALGPDLSRGVADFRRVWPTSGKTAQELAAEAEAAGSEVAGSEVAGSGAEAPGSEAAGFGTPAGRAEVTDMASAEPVSGADVPVGEDIFDESAIEALEHQEETATAAF